MKLGVYATVYNNVSTVEETIKSFYENMKNLFDRIEFVITDNFSDDGTYEKLKELSNKFNIEVIRIKCTRGKGRQIALEKTLEKDIDFLMYIDLDTKFYPDTKIVFNTILNKVRDYEIWNNGFATRKTYEYLINKGIKWPDKNFMEDWLWVFYFTNKGNIVSKLLHYPYSTNAIYTGKDRELRYSKNKISKIKRFIRTKFDIYTSWLTSSLEMFKLRKDLKMKKRIIFSITSLYTQYITSNKIIDYLPEEFGLDREMLFYNGDFIRHGLLNKIIDDESVKVIKTKNWFYLFRNLDKVKIFFENMWINIEKRPFENEKMYRIRDIYWSVI